MRKRRSKTEIAAARAAEAKRNANKLYKIVPQFPALDRPWWSQPHCETCYIKRFLVPCRVRSSWRVLYKCCMCGEDTIDGIYCSIDSTKYPTREMGKWLKANPSTPYAAFIRDSRASRRATRRASR